MRSPCVTTYYYCYYNDYYYVYFYCYYYDYDVYCAVPNEPPDVQCLRHLLRQSPPVRPCSADRGTCSAMSPPCRSTGARGNIGNASDTGSIFAHVIASSTALAMWQVIYLRMATRMSTTNTHSCLLRAAPGHGAATWRHPSAQSQINTSAFLIHVAVVHEKNAGKTPNAHMFSRESAHDLIITATAHEPISCSLRQTSKFLHQRNDIFNIRPELSITYFSSTIAHPSPQQGTYSIRIAPATLQ